MAKVIQQSVEFAATPKQLYDLYMDARRHSEATGGCAKISKKVGASFTAWDGYIRGKNLHLVPGKCIVQTWRTSEFAKGDPDSILVLSFTPIAKGARLELTHSGLPPDQVSSYRSGWRDHYWKPWRAYLRTGSPA